MSYRFLTQINLTPQTQAIPGRETEMIRGRSGAVTFDCGPWQKLRRCLLIGTATGTYYADKRELTAEFGVVVFECVELDADRVAKEILYASDGRSLNNSAPILALVWLSMGTSRVAKTAFVETFPQVVRTGSHFYEWLSYTKALRGFGKVIKACGRAWLGNPDVKALTYQLLKYQQRYGFSHRDALRLFHNAPATPEHQTLYNWVTHGWQSLPDAPPSDALSQLWWYEWVKRHPDQACHAITQGGLTHEMVAPVAQMTQQAWQKLFERMPIGALLRNLGSLTEIGVLGPRRRKNLERVAQVLVNRQHLRRGRIHPIDVLKALKTYQSGGRLGRSKKTWRPVGKILNILEQALALSFETVEPTGKTFLHALDISGSMSYYTVGSIGLSCCEIATTMALATAKAETKGYIRGFSTEFKNLGITANDSFVSAIRKASDQNFGGTDASVAYQWAIRKRVKIDVFCFWTDSESWAGNQHPSQALKTYRQRVNSKAQAIYVTLAPYQLTLVDPQDPLSWDFGGFDTSVPRAIQAIATGEFQDDR